MADNETNLRLTRAGARAVKTVASLQAYAMTKSPLYRSNWFTLSNEEHDEIEKTWAVLLMNEFLAYSGAEPPKESFEEQMSMF